MDVETLRGKTAQELDSELVALRREQFNLRMQQATGQLTQTHQFKTVRRNIARIKTVKREAAAKE
ncbi:50S ribosomal protein L29 [Salinisphaera sp. USBA-960]|uniref:50S ribosomal protein L29 n=1 Tax=Salinisphaera orenii TaxID=856731 RepID=UPI000DBE5664|nr:50S ribosomal protein L29 [Salifodinibacter halophilus]NNC26684.1 50S ribosomal protein L29 [Salifodinibacter halophilus]